MRRLCIIILLGVSLLVGFSSCRSSSFPSTFRLAESRNAFVAIPLIVEYDTVVNQVVTDTSIFRNKNEMGLLDYDNLKKLAVINCSKKYGCDVLINPSYDISYSYKTGKATIIVSGLPARYKRIRQATAADVWILKFLDQ